jgi:copper chaperone CopZ
MKKRYRLENLDCANCAAKMEAAIQKIPGVEEASISFMTQKLTIVADEARLDEILKEAAAACRRVEPDCTLVF